jgi:hypothetical protein
VNPEYDQGKPMTECVVTPVDLAGQSVELNKEVSKFLICLHAESVEFHFCCGFRIRVSEHVAELLNETGPIVQPVRWSKTSFIFVFKLCVEMMLG